MPSSTSSVVDIDALRLQNQITRLEARIRVEPYAPALPGLQADLDNLRRLLTLHKQHRVLTPRRRRRPARPAP